MKYLGFIVPLILFSFPTTLFSKTIPIACIPYLPMIEQYDWNVQTAIDVMANESGCNPDAVNLNDFHVVKKDKVDKQLWYCQGSYGLFEVTCADEIRYDAAGNIAQAYAIYKDQGWLVGWTTTCTKKVDCMI